MADWDVKQLAEDVMAGNLDGCLHQTLQTLSVDQLTELVEAMKDIQRAKDSARAAETS